jgi:hypothetical protein
MRVLVACECSGAVRDAIKANGHHAVSCDLLPTSTPGMHYQGDVRDLLDGWEPVQFTRDCTLDGATDDYCTLTQRDCEQCSCVGPTQEGVEYREVNGVLLGRPEDHLHWDLMIGHPPCTDLAASGARWFKVKGPERIQQAVDFVRLLADAPIPKIAIENPIGLLSSMWRKPDQIVQPWWFGDEATKSTCLWLKGLPPLVATNVVGKGERHVTKSGRSLPTWYNLPPSPERGQIRSKTFGGFAQAIADQWCPRV